MSNDIKQILRLTNNNFIFIHIKNRSKKDIPILDMEEDSDILLDADLNNQINKNGTIKMEEL
jgi:copper(I)-binding protein